MSDLTRRVLEAVQGIADTHVCDQPDIEYSLDILADAAPILARQVEAVENALCKAEDWIGQTVEDDYSDGMAYMINSIRRALTDTGRN